jgi:hypothetical protein
MVAPQIKASSIVTSQVAPSYFREYTRLEQFRSHMSEVYVQLEWSMWVSQLNKPPQAHVRSTRFSFSFSTFILSLSGFELHIRSIEIKDKYSSLP